MKRDLLFRYCTGPCFKEEALDQVVGRCFPRGVENLKILDVGCRNGEWVNALHKRGAIVYGVDQCQHALGEAKERFPHLADRFAQVNAQELGTCQNLQGLKFDYIFCLGMLCYLSLEDQQKAFHEMCKILLPKGEVWASFPRALTWWQKIFVFVGNLMPLPFLRLGAQPFAYLMQWINPMVQSIYPKNYWPYWGLYGIIGLTTHGPSFAHGLHELTHDLSPLCFSRTSHLFCFKTKGEQDHATYT